MNRAALRRRLVLPLALAVAPVAALLGAMGGTASADTTPAPRLSLPAPTGPYRVGTTTAELPGASDRPELMAQLWYPTKATQGRDASYFPPKTTLLAARTFHVPVKFIARIDTHALVDATPVDGAHPVVLFSPGENGLRSDSTSLELELASRGFVVVGFDVPGESALVEYPNGQVIPGTWKDTGDRSRAQAVQTRVTDLRAGLHGLSVIDNTRLLRNRLDLTRIGMFGFSLGGATTADALRALPQIRAGVDLDGSLYGSALTTPLRRPFMLLARNSHSTKTDPSWQSAWSQLHDFHREIRIVGAGHESFSDNATFINALNLEGHYPPAEIGTIPPDRATTAVGQLLTAFFDRYLNSGHTDSAILDTPHQLNANLVRIG